MVRIIQHPIVSPDPFIFIREYALEPDFCHHVITKFLDDENKVKGVCGEYAQENTIKDSIDLCIDRFDNWSEETNIFRTNLKIALQEYVNHIQSHVVLPTYGHNKEPDYAQFTACNGQIIDYGFQIQETKPCGSYDWHDDSMIAWNHQHERVLTYIYYLNDIWEDGCTEFMNGLKIPPREGRLIIFPATWTYMHRGSILHGIQNKYIATGWIYKDHSQFNAPCELTASDNESILDDTELKDEEINELLLDYEPPIEGEITLNETILQ